MSVAATEAYQVSKPLGLDLPEVASVAGTTFRGNKARIYWLLALTASQGLRWPIGVHSGPPGWVPTHLFREPWSGGQSGGKRRRELRALGVSIQSTPWLDPATGKPTDTNLYRIVLPAKPAPPAPAAEPTRNLELDGVTIFRAGEQRPSEAHSALCLVPGMGHLAPPSRCEYQPEKEASAAYRAYLQDLYRLGDLTHQILKLDRSYVYGPGWALDVFSIAVKAMGGEFVSHCEVKT